MKFSFKSSLKALLACAMMLQIGVISAKAADLPQIEAANIANVESDKTGAGYSASKLIDGDKTTNGRWETDYSQDVTNRMPVTITFTLDGAYNVGKVILYTDTNKGAPTDFTVSTSMDNATWTAGTQKTLAQSDMAETGATSLIVEFTPEEAKYVRIVVNHTTATANDYNPADGFLKLAEIELFGEASATVDKGALQALYDEAAEITAQGFYTNESWATFTAAKTAADTVLKDDAATREQVDTAKANLQSALNGLTETPISKIANTSITNIEANQADTGNDPNTLHDGNTTNRWQTPYSPFETVRVPVIFNVTLDTTYKVGKVSLYTNNGNTGAPLSYQLETSTDNTTWNTAHSVTFEQNAIPSTGYTPLSIRFAPETAKYVRITVTATSATTSNPVNTFLQLTEIEVFGDVDMTELATTITDSEAKAAQTNVYTSVSIAALQTVIDAAKLLQNNGSATAAQVTAQITALQDAIKALVRLADKTALKAKLDEVKALDTTGKTPNSVKVLQDAITAAEAVYNDAQAVQADADAQIAKLTEAVGKLVNKANVSALDAAIKAAQEEVAKTDVYTEASINAVQDIIDEATDLMNDANAAQDAVDAEVTKLNDAVAAMDKIGKEVDKTPLTNLIAAAKELVVKTNLYTSESLADLQAAIDVAEAAFDTVDSTVAVQEQVQLLRAAIDALEEKGTTPTLTPVNKSELVAAINDAKKEVSKTDVYTAESLADLQAAIDAAEAAFDTVDSTVAVQEQVQLLRAVIDALEEKGTTPTPTPVDKSELVAAINDAKKEASKTDVYTAESLADLKDVIKAAEAVMKSEDATKQDVTAAIAAIESAIETLVEIKDEEPSPTPDKAFQATDKDTNVRIYAEAGVVDPNAKLVVKPINVANANDKVAAALKSLGGKQLAYDVTLLLNNVAIQPNGRLYIYFDVPKEFFAYKNFKMYHISDDGKIEEVIFNGAGTVENGGGVNFQADHLSIFVLVAGAEEAITPSNPIDKNPVKPNTPIKNTADVPSTAGNAMAMSFVILLAGAFAVLSYKRKNNNA